MTFDNLNKHVHKCIDTLIEDKLNYYAGTLSYNSQTWKVSFRRTKVTDGISLGDKA